MKKILTIMFSLLIATPAFSGEFLANVSLNNKKIGNFIIYDRDNKQYIEASALRALKINSNITEDEPLTYFNQFGNTTYDWDQAENNLIIKSNELGLIAEKASIGIDTPSIANRKNDIKSLDYQFYSAFGSSVPTKQYSFTGTGRAFDLDLDFNYYSQSRPSGDINWHNEKNDYVKDVKIGAVPLNGIDRGFSATNEGNTRFQSSFGVEQIEVNYPIGTKIDVYNGETYLKTYDTDKPQFIISLPVNYGNTTYKLVTVTPSGERKEQLIVRSIDSFMTKTGNFTYNIGAGVNRLDDFLYSGKFNYGLNSKLSLFTEVDQYQVNGGAFYSPIANWMLSGKAGTKGFSGNSIYNNQSLGVFSGSVSSTKNITQINAIVVPKVLFSPVLSYVETIMPNSDAKTIGIRTGFSFFEKLYVSPRFEYAQNKNGDNVTHSEAVGLQSIFHAKHEITFRTDALYTQSMTGGLANMNVELEKRFGTFASVSTKTNLNLNAGKLNVDSTDLNLQFFGNKYVSVSAGINHNWQTNDNTATFSLTGSLTRIGATNTQQAQSGTMLIRTYVDKSGEGHYVPGVDTLIPAVLRVDGRLIEHNGEYIAYSLTPYIPYAVQVEPEVDVEPLIMDFKMVPTRGEVSTLEIAYKVVSECSGRLANHLSNQLIELKLADGTIKKVYTSYDGFWETRVREDLTPNIPECGKGIKPVVAPVVVAKPAVVVKPVVVPVAIVKPIILPVVDPAIQMTLEKLDKLVAQKKIVEPEIIVNVAGETKPEHVKKAVKHIKKHRKSSVILVSYGKTQTDAVCYAKSVQAKLKKQGISVSTIRYSVPADKKAVDVIGQKPCIAYYDDCFKLEYEITMK